MKSGEVYLGMKEKRLIREGLITESLSNGMFRVQLNNKNIVMGYISGKIRKNLLRILPGDFVKIEMTHYDSNKGRIIYRL
uniref:Translation initiation factor IF-1, chloroplastic n=1 Tax=Didymoplexis pallens TaxID=2848458 RepID=A0A976YHH2_9ASPA|nr:translational initiation factor 1 [Didymoplexis pallens]UVG41010.1 translational initiation factor 1 [Didymoplexis pallens]